MISRVRRSGITGETPASASPSRYYTHASSAPVSAANRSTTRYAVSGKPSARLRRTMPAPERRTLAEVVRRDAPEGFFADRPDTVRQVIEKPPARLGTLAKREREYGAAAGEVGFLVAAPVAVACEIEEARCGQRGPRIAKKRLGFRDQPSPDRARQGLPPARIAAVGAGTHASRARSASRTRAGGNRVASARCPASSAVVVVVVVVVAIRLPLIHFSRAMTAVRGRYDVAP